MSQEKRGVAERARLAHCGSQASGMPCVRRAPRRREDRRATPQPAHGRATGARRRRQTPPYIALGGKQDPFASGIFPVERILAGVCPTCAQRRVRSRRALPRSTPVTANEDHHGRGVQAAAVSARVRRPARKKVIVTLDLCRRPARGQAVVELDDHVDRRCVWGFRAGAARTTIGGTRLRISNPGGAVA